MADTPRRKVGDKDPNFEKDKAASAAKEARVKASKAADAAAAPKPAVATPAAKRSVLEDLRDALNEKIPREATHGGQTVDEVVNQAVNDAAGAPLDY